MAVDYSVNPEMTRMTALDCQVCVPEKWTDEQVIEFAEKEYPSGLSHKWIICKTGSKWLGKDPERNPCQQRLGFVHIHLGIGE